MKLFNKPEEVQENDGKPADLVELIKNPLPLPKKGRMRRMEFDHNIPAEDLRYDLDISGDDDFDIK